MLFEKCTVNIYTLRRKGFLYKKKKLFRNYYSLQYYKRFNREINDLSSHENEILRLALFDDAIDYATRQKEKCRKYRC